MRGLIISKTCLSVSNMSEETKDWSYTSHIGEDLRGVDLSGADLRRAVFDRADLEGARSFWGRFEESVLQGSKSNEGLIR